MTVSFPPMLAQLDAVGTDQLLSFGLLIVGIVFISAWLLMRIRKRSLRGPGHPTAREHLERYKQQDGVKNDLEGLMVEIEQLAKRVGAQLDAKSIRLERLIDDADLRIAQLQRDMHQQHATPPESPPESPPEASQKIPSELPPNGSSASSPSTSRSHPEAAAAQAAAGGSAPTPGKDADPGDAIARRIHGLADQGLAPAEIAHRLGEHQGKVELILALRPGK
ncbi:MAG: hypothetical protein AAGG38_11930 [Planctomycetota bacterium]